MATGRQPNGILYDGRFLWGKYKGRAVQDAPDDDMRQLNNAVEALREVVREDRP